MTRAKVKHSGINDKELADAFVKTASRILRRGIVPNSVSWDFRIGVVKDEPLEDDGWRELHVKWRYLEVEEHQPGMEGLADQQDR